MWNGYISRTLVIPHWVEAVTRVQKNGDRATSLSMDNPFASDDDDDDDGGGGGGGGLTICI